MLSDSDVHVDIGVKDLQKSKAFYTETLELKPVHEDEQEVIFRSGNSKLKIYQSSYAGTNQATYASWDVGDVESCVDWLKGKGVEFEHYDIPGATSQGDVHVMGDVKAAWFKDPDGNVLCIASD